MMYRSIFVACVAAVALAAPASAQDGRLELTTERVVVFKDGHCLVVKKAVGTANAAGEVFTEEVPDAAVLGSFWATSPDGPVRSMTAALVESEEQTVEREACSQYLELLSVNEGKQATVELDDGTTIVGVVRKVLTRTAPRPLPAPAAWSSFAPPRTGLDALRRESTDLIGSLFTLATDAGDVVLGVQRIRKLTMRDMELEIERKVLEKRSTKRLTFRLDGAGAKQTLHLMYFRPGVRWIPTYRIDLGRGDDTQERAQVRLQAEILNEAEDLLDVPFDVVVGVPNFRFKEVVSPFVLEQTLRNALQQAAPTLMSQSLSNGFFVNQTGDVGAPAAGAIDLPEEIVAGRTQDLFVYSLPRMTVRKGERAAVPVFDTTATYRDLHTWEVAVRREDIEAAPSGGAASPLTLSTNRVWHQIELTNDSGLPWTTGAVLILDGHQPVAQELLTYTSVGGKVRVPLTVAVDVRGTFDEEETGRKLDALTWLRQAYARIDKTGRLSITNYKRHAIDVEVRCRLGGHADEATDDGHITVGAFASADWGNYLGHPAANNHSSVTFMLRLEPGATRSPQIRYHYFTRH